MKFKAIIFDCDGVLVDSEAMSMGILLQLGQQIGFEMDQQEALEQFSGVALQQILAYMEKHGQQKFPADIIEEYRRLTYEAFRQNIQAVPGIRALLQKMTLPRCVASNAPQEKIRLNLGLLELLPYFGEHIYSAYDVERWKPAPHLFLHAAEKLGFIPQECAVVEDSLAGVQAAKAGGFTVFGYAHGHRANELAQAGAIVFDHMDKLPQLWETYDPSL
ncbi:MAG: HAD family hydrolase [Aureispira sp.]